MHSYCKYLSSTITLIIIGLFFASPAMGQSKAKTKKARWSVDKPFEQYCFIENKGQFPQAIMDIAKDPILYYTQKGQVAIYFTPGSVVYKFDSIVANKDDEGEGRKADRDADLKVVPYSFSMSWEGANPNPRVEVQNEESNYYTYPNIHDKSGKTGIKANAWEKLIYHNIYNGIDVEFYYPKDKGGIEYSVIVHPGADIAAFKMKYNGADVKLEDKNVIINSPFGIFTDHEPSTVSDGENSISSGFNVNNNMVTFSIGNYDKSHSITIDPWTTTPAFKKGTNKAYDLDYDNQGNVYIAGGGAQEDYEILKFNSAGVQQWTYVASFTYNVAGSFGGTYYFYCDITVDHRNGTSYFAEGYDGGTTEPSNGGCRVVKVNSSGTQYGLFNGDTNLYEMWRLRFDYCHNILVIAGGQGSSTTNEAATLDTALTTLTPVDVLGIKITPTDSNYFHDMALMALDGLGNAYMATNNPSTDSGGFFNVFMRLPLPSLAPTAYMKPDGHNFWELASISYYPTRPNFHFANIVLANGFNGMAVRNNMLLTYDGKELKKWRPSNGAYVDSIKVSSNYFEWGGIDIDCGGNIYVGNNKQVNIYDSLLAPVSTPITFKNVIYDLELNGQGQIYACGDGFVAADTVPSSLSPKLSVTSTAPTSCKTCNGKATAIINACDAVNYYFKWSNGATTQSVSNLCDGSYTVTVRDTIGCLPMVDSATFTLGMSSYSVAITAHTTATCKTKGTATATVSGGIAPFKYSWSNGDTNKVDTGMVAGTYTVSVTDSDTCVVTATLTITSSGVPIIAIAPADTDSVCSGNSITLSASGGGISSWAWSPASSLNVTTSDSVIASPIAATTYTVIATDTSGCTGKDSILITIAHPPVISVSPSFDSVCSGGNITITASGGVTYTWLPATGLSCTSCSNPTATVTANTIYTVTGTTAPGCSNTTTDTIKIAISPVVTVTASPGDSICLGDTVVLTASGATTYTWLPGGSTADTFSIPHDSNTGSYKVVGSNGFCKDTVTFTETIKQQPPTKIVTDSISICRGDSVRLIAVDTVGNGSFTWYNTSPTNPIIGKDTITQKPDSTSSYVLENTVAGRCPGWTNITINVVQKPKPVISVPGGTICSGSNITLTASGATTYRWSTGATGSSATITPTNSGTTPAYYSFYLIAGNSCFADTTYDSVLVQPVPPVKITCDSTLVCLGDTLTLTASGATNYTWLPSGSTKDTIVILHDSLPGTYTVVGGNGTCNDTVKYTVTIQPQSPTNIKVIPSNDTICAGATVTLIAINDSTGSFTWYNTSPKNPMEGDTITQTPDSSSRYVLQNIISGKCPGYGAITVNVIQKPAKPVIKISPHDTICFGSSVTLTASGSANYTWSTTATGTSITVTPTISGSTPTYVTYYVFAKNKCFSSDTSYDSVLIEPKPNLTITCSPALICIGDTDTLTVSGATSYIWHPSGSTNNSIVLLNDSFPGTYTVIGSKAGCTDTALYSLIIQPQAPHNITVSPGDTVCPGQTVTLYAKNDSTGSFTWYNTSPNNPMKGDSIKQNPDSTSRYVLQNLITGVCPGYGSITIYITPKPLTPVITPLQDYLCSGDPVTLTASGVGNYTWSNGATGSSTVVNPLASGTTPGYDVYYVVSSNKCYHDTIRDTVVAEPKPDPKFSGNTLICSGTTTNLSVSSTNGNPSYVWSTGSNASTIAVRPTAETIYTVIATNVYCQDTAQDTVKIITVPSVHISGPTSVCEHDTITLTASAGGTTYSWSNGMTGNPIPYSPNATGTVYVVATNSSGCADTAYWGVWVTPDTNVIACCDTSIDLGGSAHVIAIGTPNSGYQWYPLSGNINNANAAATLVTPTVSTTYTVVCTDDSGCVSRATVTVDIACQDFTVPNVFTPVSSQTFPNNVFYIKGSSQEPNYSIEIYDRWGHKVFSSTNPADPWNGKVDNTGAEVADGVYYYIIKSSCGSNNYDKKGYVEVLK